MADEKKKKCFCSECYIEKCPVAAEMFKWYDVNSGSGYANV